MGLSCCGRVWAGRAVILGVLLGVCSVVAHGQAATGNNPTLEAIGKEVERLRRELARFEKEESGILGSLERLSMERLLLEEEIRRVDLEMESAERAAEESRRRSGELEKRLDEGRRYLAASLRQSYKLGRLRHYRVLLEASDAAAFARAYRYLSDWARADSARVESFIEDASELQITQEALQVRLSELERLRQEGEERRGALERNRAARIQALRRVEEEHAAGTAAFLELEEAAGRLHALVASLPGGKPVPIDGRMVDLHRFRGHLPWPVSGPVKVPFGDVLDHRFGTRVPHPGIKIDVKEGTLVHPVFGGWVVFADWFRGYGNTVMVDHGGGLLSVYAHLRSVDVAAGDQVNPGTEMGRSGSTGSLVGPVLYLEIREGGKAVDPRRWLAPSPA
jgi:septal ring factor EnvC (AmiA/AmiB activator)